MVAIPARQLIGSGDGASTSCSASKPAETNAAATEAETSSRPGRPVIESSSSEEEEEEEEMQRRRPYLMIVDLSTRVFGDRAPCAPRPADVAPTIALGSVSTAAADAAAPAADAAAPASTSPLNSSSILSLDPAIAQNVSGSDESASPANVQPQSEDFVNDVLPSSLPHIVQEGLDVDAVNDPANIQSQLEENFEVPLTVQEGYETAQLPSFEFDNSPVQVEAVDPSISKEVVQAEEFPIAVGSEAIVIENPVEPSEVQDQLPSGSTSQVEAEGDSHNTIISEVPLVPAPSTVMHGVEVATDDMAQSLSLQARVICTRAADHLKEQPEELMDDS
ncbi:hypothetical protein MRB53_030309 [Persea americana]|uniref:Uncharacterized protein n=1 Tax=Persea americana TaxID=3435 RepID=A0ACC2KKX7_PERAE|nr:hypothetical protein MRB53_030309 [Persea americana]